MIMDKMSKRSLADLSPNPKNPRKITNKKLAMLGESLRRFGDLSGVIYNRTSKQLIGGHQRIKAFGETQAIVVLTAEYDQPTATGTVAEGYVAMNGEKYAYREVEFDDATEKAANLAANANAGTFDLPQVAEWMQELEAVDFDMNLTMFDEDERKALEPEQMPSEPDPEEDVMPEPPAEPTAKPGDIWQLGRHRLMCGDSSNVQHIDTLMGGKKADMVYTDPPYGMKLKTDYDSGRNKLDNNKYSSHSNTAKIKRNNWRPVHGDDEDFDPSIVFGYFEGVPEIFLWGADYYAQDVPRGGSWIVWDKRSKADGEVIEQFKASHFELCWSKKQHLREIARILWSGIMKAEHDGARVHPTQKPVMLTEWFFERWGKPGDIVVDLYGGSGSTLLACEKQGRTCHMMEIDAAYVDVIIKRWEKLTGQTAELVSNGDSMEDANA